MPRRTKKKPTTRHEIQSFDKRERKNRKWKRKTGFKIALHVKSLNDFHVHSYLFCAFFFSRLALSSMSHARARHLWCRHSAMISIRIVRSCALGASDDGVLQQNYYRKRSSYELFVIWWQNNARRQQTLTLCTSVSFLFASCARCSNLFLVVAWSVGDAGTGRALSRLLYRCLQTPPKRYCVSPGIRHITARMNRPHTR